MENNLQLKNEYVEKDIMSLIDELMEKFILVDKVTTDDGYGGVNTSYIDGATISATAILDSSMESRIAQADGFTNVYTITTSKNVSLEFHQILKRVSDGKVFRVTSDGSDKHSPATSTLDIRQVSAEVFAYE